MHVRTRLAEFQKRQGLLGQNSNSQLRAFNYDNLFLAGFALQWQSCIRKRGFPHGTLSFLTSRLGK